MDASRRRILIARCKQDAAPSDNAAAHAPLGHVRRGVHLFLAAGLQSLIRGRLSSLRGAFIW